MAMPDNIGIIDMMLGLPITEPDQTYAFLKVNVHDRESKEQFKFPVEYMFKGVPHDFGKGRDPVEATLEEMDRWGIEKAPLSVDERRQKVAVALFIGIFVVLGSIALLGYIFSK